jgi:oligoribonuclease
MAHSPSQMPPLVWIDLEMTGLDLSRDTVIEIATIVTSGELEILEEGPNFAIHHPDEVLKSMHPWSQDTFDKSGLTERCRASTISMATACEQTLAFVKKWCKAPRQAPLCGNSVGTDRTFLFKDMRPLHDWLHYRNVDVSSFKEMIRRWYPGEYAVLTGAALRKPDTHQALEDIRWSIAELRLYRQHFLRDVAVAPDAAAPPAVPPLGSGTDAQRPK